MAIYHASTKPIARSDGRSAVAAAAYRAGVELVDARTGLVHDYTRKSGVELTEILTPDGRGAERNALWDAAEQAEKRKDARTAREWVVALPAELSADQRAELAREFAQALVARYGVAVDLAIHAPDREGDNRNHHAHLLTTTRQVSRGMDGGLILGDKTLIELSDKRRRELKLGAAADEVKSVRELWEHTANAALERAGVEVRIDARSLQAQGIDREATQHLGPVASEMERRGRESDRGNGNREVQANNARRAALSAEIIDLHAERKRREREAAEIKRKESILKKAQDRQQEREQADQIKIRDRWNRRKKVRRNRQLDAETAAEQRPGIRHPDRPQWQVYRERMLTEAYNREVAEALGRWAKVERGASGLRIHNKQLDLTDRGDRITAGLGGNNYEIDVMLQLARAKGWKQIEFTGDEAFRERAGARALASGFDLADTALKERIRDRQRQAAERRAAIDRQVVAALAQWMEKHPGQAANQRRARGAIPGLGPDGVDLAIQRAGEGYGAASEGAGVYASSDSRRTRRSASDGYAVAILSFAHERPISDNSHPGGCPHSEGMWPDLLQGWPKGNKPMSFKCSAPVGSGFAATGWGATARSGRNAYQAAEKVRGIIAGTGHGGIRSCVEPR
jgi:hypothetical protein